MSENKKKRAVLILNLGTPDSATRSGVGRFLREFLMDPLIIEIPWFFRWLLVNLIIVPFRSKKVAIKYQSIWLPEGSPLMHYSKKFAERLDLKLSSNSNFETRVYLAMRYGKPSISKVLPEIVKFTDEVLVVPMYPQYAKATTLSTLLKVGEEIENLGLRLKQKVFPEFYNHPKYLNVLTSSLNGKSVKTLVCSYHGLPKTALLSTCKDDHSCCADLNNSKTLKCYRAQCEQTTRCLGKELGLAEANCTTSFQSRFGPAKWIGPATIDTLTERSKSNSEGLVVVCPSFVVDCLETLEEIVHMKMGTYSPCLNDNQEWVDSFAEMIEETYA